MKKIFIVLSVLVCSVGFAAEEKKESKSKDGGGGAMVRNYGMAGCGLGSVLMGKRGAQIFAATTNATAFNQSFGITAGTLNCVDSGHDQVAVKSDRFIQVNRYALESDVARGNGETLSGLSKVLGCSSSQSLGTALQKKYSDVFSTEFAPNEITDSIITVILNEKELLGQCTLS